jgi:chromosome segregation ATPase
MKEVERLLKLKEEIQNESANAAKLEARLGELKSSLPVLESRWVETEDEKEAKAIEAELNAAREEIEQLPLEIKKAKRKIELLEQRLPKYEEQVIGALRQAYMEKLKPLVKELVKRWRLVAEVESEIKNLKDRAQLDLVKVTSAPRILLPYIPTYFINPDENAVAVSKSGMPFHPFTKLKKMIEALAQEGFEVSPKETD